MRNRLTAATCIATLVLTPLLAQQPQPEPPSQPVLAGQAGLIQSLKLYVLQGQGAFNDIQARVAISPVVEVRDLLDQPVEGAEVIFSLPAQGPGGTFPGGKAVFTGRTNLRGQVSAPLMPNTLPGRFEITVTASAGNRFAKATIRQVNVTNAVAAETGGKKRGLAGLGWKWWAAIGAGATTALILTTRGGSSPAQSPNATIVVGGPAVGAPR